MTVITIGSVVGSPGATTTALALVRRHHRPVVLVEADPDGGRLALRLNTDHRPGLVDLLTSARDLDADTLFHGVQRRDPHSSAQVVVAHPAGDIVERALRTGVHDLVTTLRHATFDVVCDVGRYRLDSPAEPLMRMAAWRVVATRGDLGDVAVVAHALDRVKSWGRVMVAVTGRGAYGPHEVSEALGVPTSGIPPVGESLPSRRYLRAIDAMATRLFDGGEH